MYTRQCGKHKVNSPQMKVCLYNNLTSLTKHNLAQGNPLHVYHQTVTNIWTQCIFFNLHCQGVAKKRNHYYPLNLGLFDTAGTGNTVSGNFCIILSVNKPQHANRIPLWEPQNIAHSTHLKENTQHIMVLLIQQMKIKTPHAGTTPISLLSLSAVIRHQWTKLAFRFSWKLCVKFLAKRVRHACLQV